MYFLDVLYVPRGINLYAKQEHWDVQNIQKILLQHILLPCNPPPTRQYELLLKFATKLFVVRPNHGLWSLSCWVATNDTWYATIY